MLGSPKPAGLHPFKELRGETHLAPSTPGDLFFHIRATRMDMCFELAQLLTDRLEGVARVVDEVHGFKSFDERDLLGFVDGTENPEPYEAPEAALVGEEEPEFAGGSYLIVQKYLHDLTAWNRLTVEEQEQAFGRTKLDDVEFADEDKASNSHLVLNVIEDEDGEERQIMRFNMPFGRVGEAEFGTYFIGYAADAGVTELMLERMFIGVPPGNHDRILDFSTATTGSLFFVPSAEFLDGLGDDDPDQAADEDQPEQPDAGAEPAGGSLGIGDAR
jgi:putative iron-dependent peroxidase